MPRFFVSHGFDERARPGVFWRKAIEMAFEVPLHLLFRLREKAEVPIIAEPPGDAADREGAGVPERIEHAPPPAQLGDSLRAPGEVIAFFPRRLFELRLQRRIARGERLALVERLRADFAAVIDPHEGGGALALEVRQIGLRVLP